MGQRFIRFRNCKDESVFGDWFSYDPDWQTNRKMETAYQCTRDAEDKLPPRTGATLYLYDFAGQPETKTGHRQAIVGELWYGPWFDLRDAVIEMAAHETIKVPFQRLHGENTTKMMLDSLHRELVSKVNFHADGLVAQLDGLLADYESDHKIAGWRHRFGDQFTIWRQYYRPNVLGFRAELDSDAADDLVVIFRCHEKLHITRLVKGEHIEREGEPVCIMPYRGPADIEAAAAENFIQEMEL